MPAIQVHHTSTSDGSWDGSAAKSNLKLDQDQDYYDQAFAWRDPDADDTTKAAYKFIHHEVTSDGKIGAANLTACSTGIGVLNGGRGGTTIPDSDRQGVWNHLAAHLKDADREPPELSKQFLPAMAKEIIMAKEGIMAKQRGRKNLTMQIKQVNGDGSFEGLLAVYNVKDLGGDVIVQGAFTKTIQEHGSTVPLLWQHKSDEPIGTLQLQDTPDALKVRGQLLMDLPTAQKAQLLLKAGIIRGLSIGYDTIKDTVDSGVRFLKELRLWEGSIVTFPMNEAAMVTTVKALTAIRECKADFDTELAAQQIADAGQQIMNALYYALSSNTWSNSITDDDKVEAAKECLSQFVDAYLAWLPQYLAWIQAEYGPMDTMQRRRMESKVLKMRLQFKEGRTISADTKGTLQAILDHCSQAHDDAKSINSHMMEAKSFFQTLLPDEADVDAVIDAVDDVDDDVDNTASAKAAKEKNEPITIDHSAEVNTVNSLIALFRAKKTG